MTAVFLALAASASYGVSSFLGGLYSRRLSLASVLAVTAPIGLAAIAVFTAVRAAPPPGSGFALYAAATGVLGAVGIASLYRGLAVGRMGIVSPIAATSPLIPVAFGLARGERPSPVQGAGMALALAGVVLAAREPNLAAGRRLATGAGLGLLAAACFGSSVITLDEASNADPYWAALVVRGTSALVFGTVLLVTRSPVRAPRSALGPLAVLALVDGGGTLCFAVATTKGFVSVVAVLVSLFPVTVVLLARFALHERLERSQLAGGGAALAGVALISAG